MEILSIPSALKNTLIPNRALRSLPANSACPETRIIVRHSKSCKHPAFALNFARVVAIGLGSV